MACCPVFLAYALVERERVRLFAAREIFSPELADALARDGVELCPYEGIFEALRGLPGGSRLWLDSAAANYALFASLPAGTHVTDKPTPVVLAKSVKNEAEIEGERTAHLYDGIALTKFLYRLKTGGVEGLTELSAARILEELRRGQPGYLGPSFETISAYGTHGAVVHYAPTPETDLPLEARSFLLVDSGGQYRTGTTDVTRTIALGPLTGQERQLYTAVLRGHLALAAARFRQGCTGRNLDYLARAPLWEKGLDYNHGTGHGVGFLLNVHEGPNNIRWRPAQNPADDAVLLPGMITSDEPGIYLDGRFGVRLENLLLCTEIQRTEYGVFLGFEPLTLAPFDRQAILPGEMTGEERALPEPLSPACLRDPGPPPEPRGGPVAPGRDPAPVRSGSGGRPCLPPIEKRKKASPPRRGGFWVLFGQISELRPACSGPVRRRPPCRRRSRCRAGWR